MAIIEKLNSIGDAIREKTGTANLLTLDGMAAAIKGIETGSNLKIVSGTVTPTEDCNELVITHNLGVVPKIVIFRISSGVSSASLAAAWCIDGVAKGGLRHTLNSMTYYGTGGNGNTDIRQEVSDGGHGVGSATDTQFTVRSAASVYIRAKAYVWYAIG